MSLNKQVSSYFNILADAMKNPFITDSEGVPLTPHAAYARVLGELDAMHKTGGKVMFVGNGGSAAVASHMAIDYVRNGKLRALCFNDASALTCMANDFGYENVFAKQIAMHACPGDVLMAISSSGASANILKAVGAARERGCKVYTFSGFAEENPLRTFGDLNFYVASSEYGVVEISHLALIHSILDIRRELQAASAETVTQLADA